MTRYKDLLQLTTVGEEIRKAAKLLPPIYPPMRPPMYPPMLPPIYPPMVPPIYPPMVPPILRAKYSYTSDKTLNGKEN